MQSDEIIITQRQVDHSDLHDDVYERYGRYFPLVLEDPDYIFEDSRPERNPNTGIVTKRLADENGRALQIVLRIKTTKDPEGYKNSIISSWVIGEKRLQAYIRNRKILYIRREL